MQTCIELVIYQIKPEYQHSWASLRQALYNDLQSLAGFVDYKTYQELDQPLCFTDQVIWQDSSSAKHAYTKFATLSSAASFMSGIDKVIITKHLQDYDANKGSV